jgi:hypothetical protein
MIVRPHNSWCTDSLCNAFGKDPCSEELVKSTVDAMVDQGLRDLGYKYVALVRLLLLLPFLLLRLCQE